ncbi:MULTISPECIES: hypothetical protein [Mycolicibacter]|uniref:hypothetical protein n=1 Tax=Mycolicibacter TaxID=1073531 RepID=UPI0013FDA121|nr:MULTISPECIES: hypothetical protein [Mycolicibacter]
MRKLEYGSDGVLIDMDTGAVIGTNVRWCPLLRLDDPQDQVMAWAEVHGKDVFVDG